MKNNFFNINKLNVDAPEIPSVNIETLSKNDIAVIGMAGRLPLAQDLTVFWENLASGTDCIVDFPSCRVEDVVEYLI